VLLVSHDRALLDAVAHRTLAIEDGTIRSYDGGWADYVRRRDELAAPPPPAPAPVRQQRKPATPKPSEPSELERLEAEIATREQTVADLEQRLAEDWADADTLAAHRAARDELQALLARWEQVFDQAQA
jgi:ATPase subunit of ABC transporter with duplicated ATPase domains